ncbi:MAG: hypothetical protein WDN48_05565 [Pseudolabrys sp.]
MAGIRQFRHAANIAQGAIPDDGAGSAALLRAIDSGQAAVDQDRLGGDAANKSLAHDLSENRFPLFGIMRIQ